METDLAVAVQKNRAILNATYKLQDKKLFKYFSNPCDINSERMLMLAADIYGQIEQLEALLSVIYASNAKKLEFVHDCLDLDIDSEDLKCMCSNKDLAYFANKYGADKTLASYPVAYDSFLKHSEQFIDAIRSLDTPKATVDYLVQRKCAAIKHLCTLEYLIGLYNK